MNKLLLLFLLTPLLCFSETVKVEIPVNKDEAVWECKAPSGNSYYVKLPKGKKYSISEVCSSFVLQAQEDFPTLTKFIQVPLDRQPPMVIMEESPSMKTCMPNGMGGFDCF